MNQQRWEHRVLQHVSLASLENIHIARGHPSAFRARLGATLTRLDQLRAHSALPDIIQHLPMQTPLPLVSYAMQGNILQQDRHFAQIALLGHTLHPTGLPIARNAVQEQRLLLSLLHHPRHAQLVMQGNSPWPGMVRVWIV